MITASDTAPKPLRDLRNRCLNPGKYAQHLERWLSYFPPQQLYIVDGEVLKSSPVDVMNELQRFLKITPTFNYTTHLKLGVFMYVTYSVSINKILLGSIRRRDFFVR